MKQRAAQLADISLTLQDYIEQIEYNPKRLEQTENRLALISTLKKKYGADEQAIIGFCGNAPENNLKTSPMRKNALQNWNSRKSRPDAGTQRSSTGTFRIHARQLPKRLSKQVEKELADLKMAGARFSVSIAHKAKTRMAYLIGWQYTVASTAAVSTRLNS